MYYHLNRLGPVGLLYWLQNINKITCSANDRTKSVWNVRNKAYTSLVLHHRKCTKYTEVSSQLIEDGFTFLVHAEERNYIGRILYKIIYLFQMAKRFWYCRIVICVLTFLLFYSQNGEDISVVSSWSYNMNTLPSKQVKRIMKIAN